MLKWVFLTIFTSLFLGAGIMTYKSWGVSTPKVHKEKSVRRSSAGVRHFHGGYRHGK